MDEIAKFKEQTVRDSLRDEDADYNIDQKTDEFLKAQGIDLKGSSNKPDENVDVS